MGEVCEACMQCLSNEKRTITLFCSVAAGRVQSKTRANVENAEENVRKDRERAS